MHFDSSTKIKYKMMNIKSIRNLFQKRAHSVFSFIKVEYLLRCLLFEVSCLRHACIAQSQTRLSDADLLYFQNETVRSCFLFFANFVG